MTDPNVHREPDVLIEPAELTELLAGGSDVVLADVRWTLGGPPGTADFEQAHLPGAQWVDLDHELAGLPGPGGRHPLPAAADFEAAMRRIGVRPERLVVGYDAATSPSAARLWWLLTDAGHQRVRVLNGGLAGWLGAGLPTESGPAGDAPSGTFVARPGQRKQLQAAEIVGAIQRGHLLQLVDVRAAERYTGETEPMDPVAGHIPGAVNRASTTHVDESGRFLPSAELRAQFADLDAPVFYCGSGITAAHSLLALEASGRTGGIYPGSWSNWISDPARPVATGPTP